MAAVGFNPEDAKRISAGIRYVEKISRGGDPGRGRTSTPWNPGKKLAITTGTITARSGLQLGSGNATLYECSDTGLLSSGTAVTVWNNATGTLGVIASGIQIQVSYGYGKWLVDWEQEVCS